MKSVSYETSEPASQGRKPGQTRTPEQAREYARAYRAANLDKSRAYAREHNARKRLTNPAFFMLQNAKTRAKKQGLACTITVADIVVPTHCPILGMPLVVNVGVLGNDSPSLDKIVPALGYVPGNVQVISHLANTMKSSANPEQLRAFAAWVLNQGNAHA